MCLVCQHDATRIGTLKLYRCGSCGLVFDCPQPARADIEAHVVDYGVVSERKLRAVAEERIGRIWLSTDKHNTTMLDVGTGPGTMVKVAESLGYMVTGCDMHRTQPWVTQCDAGQIDCLPSAPFNVVVMAHVLEHCKDPADAIRAAWCALEPGGVLYVEVPNEAWWSVRRWGPALLRGWPGGWRNWSPEQTEWHLTHWNMRALRMALVGERFDFVLAGYTRVKWPLDSLWITARRVE